MEIVVEATGVVRAVYGEEIDLGTLGDMVIRRASHVEPNGQGEWTADLSPVGGPILGSFNCRSEALAAEQKWLRDNLL